MRASAEQRIAESKEVRGIFGTTAGVQIRRIRRPRKMIPDWARSETQMRVHILAPALRRYRIAYLYYMVGMSARETAEELQTTANAVMHVIRKVNRLQPE